MKRWIIGIVLLALFVMALGQAGCGNVSLQGDAMTAAQASAMDAYQAAQRSGATSTTQPSWEQSYLLENYKQWRFFVRSAAKNNTWGPKLEGE